MEGKEQGFRVQGRVTAYLTEFELPASAVLTDAWNYSVRQ